MAPTVVLPNAEFRSLVLGQSLPRVVGFKEGGSRQGGRSEHSLLGAPRRKLHLKNQACVPHLCMGVSETGRAVALLSKSALSGMMTRCQVMARVTGSLEMV